VAKEREVLYTFVIRDGVLISREILCEEGTDSVAEEKGGKKRTEWGSSKPGRERGGSLRNERCRQITTSSLSGRHLELRHAINPRRGGLDEPHLKEDDNERQDYSKSRMKERNHQHTSGENIMKSYSGEGIAGEGRDSGPVTRLSFPRGKKKKYVSLER